MKFYIFIITLFFSCSKPFPGDSGLFLLASLNNSSTTTSSSPAGLTAVAGNGQITVNWTAVSGATGYNVYYSTTTPVTTSASTVNVTTNTATITGLANGTTYYIMVTAVTASGESSPSAEVSAVPANPNKYILVTVGTWNGNLGGVSGADAKCAADKDANFSSLPGNGTDYKALLIDSTNRIACTTANCSGGAAEHTNWVLLPSTSYYLPNETIAFTTNSSGIIDFNGGATLNAVLDTDPAKHWWTGIDTADWIDAGLNCTNWGATGGLGFYGQGNLANGDSIGSVLTSESCATTTNHLLCVRQ